MAGEETDRRAMTTVEREEIEQLRHDEIMEQLKKTNDILENIHITLSWFETAWRNR